MGVGVRTTLWRVVAAALVLCATFCLVRWSDASSSGRAGNPAAGSTAATPPTSESHPSQKSRPAAGGQPARPVAVRVPAIGVTSSLVGLGLNGDGTVEVPANPALAGWYRLGTRPGAHGSAVILGHVDSVDGPAVFYRLRTVDRGDLVRVRLADGTSEIFRVDSVHTYLNERFPARQVYASTQGRSLNLVTCGGAYDADHGGYQSNVVVHARWVRSRHA